MLISSRCVSKILFNIFLNSSFMVSGEYFSNSAGIPSLPEALLLSILCIAFCASTGVSISLDNGFASP